MEMVKPAKPDSLMGLSGFLTFLFGGIEDGYCYAPTLDRETGEFKPVFVRVNKLDVLEDHVRKSSDTTDVYLSPAVFKSAKSTKDNFLTSNTAWCEFDGNSPDNFEIEPSVVVRSSQAGHTHCYWRLDSPVDNAADLETVNRSLAYSLEADKSGWDANQILRPPETWNYKRDLPVAVSEVSGTIHNLGAFSGYKLPDAIEESSIKLHNVPDVQEVIFKYAFSDEFRSVFTSNPAEGSRSTYYMRVGYLAAEAGCGNEELFALISNFDARIGKYNKRQDRTRRILDVIERVRLKHPLVTDEDGSESDEIEIFDIISFGKQDIQVEWLLPDLLQQQGNMLLSGPPGVGKTQLALNFAYGLSSGTETLGIAAADPAKVLFISCEMGPADLKYFTDQMSPRYEEYNEILQENLFIYPLGEPFYINTPKGQDKLCRLAETLNLDGIIFDSLGSATNKALTDEEATKGLLDFNDRFRKEMGVFTWFIHHNRKASETNKEPSGLADVYGSQYITARATTVLSLWPVGHSLKVRELKKRLAPAKDDWFIGRTKEGLGFEKVATPEPKTITSSKIGATQDAGNSGTKGSPSF